MDQEPRLIDEAREGSEEAFTALMRLHQAGVRAYLGRYVRDPETVRDLAQESFLNAYRNLSGYRGDAPLRIWLLAIARNQALMHLRQARRLRRETGSLGTTVAEWLTRQLESRPIESGDHELELSALRDCVQKLPETSAGLVSEYYMKGLSAPEIARRTGRKEGSVWVSLSRIRQALRQCVEGRLTTSRAES